MTLLKPVRSPWPWFLRVGGLLACVGGLMFMACDGAGSQRTSLYQRLSNEGDGPWEIEQLEGRFPPPLGERQIQIAFRNENGPRYRIIERASADSTAVLASGAVSLPRGDELQMATGFGGLGPVTWTYSFQASRAVFTLQAGSRPFLRALFPREAWGDELDVEMTLAPTDD